MRRVQAKLQKIDRLARILLQPYPHTPLSGLPPLTTKSTRHWITTPHDAMLCKLLHSRFTTSMAPSSLLHPPLFFFAILLVDSLILLGEKGRDGLSLPSSLSNHFHSSLSLSFLCMDLPSVPVPPLTYDGLASSTSHETSNNYFPLGNLE